MQLPTELEEYDSGNCQWWLRSPGGRQDRAADVYDDGSVDCYAFAVDYDGNAVCPALWINLDS